MLLTADSSALLLVDLQKRLMPAIEDGPSVVAAARRLGQAARLLGVPVAATEQNPDGLGPTVDEIADLPDSVLAKSAFAASAAPGFAELVAADRSVVVAGCEAHVCVLQTVLGLLADGRRVAVVADAVGSRRSSDKAAALQRARAHGADVITVEMAAFEWLGTAEHSEFRAAQRLIK